MNVVPPRIDYNEPNIPFTVDSEILPLFRDAGIIQGFEGIIPAAVYGKAPTKKGDGSIGVVYGSYNAFVDELDKTMSSPKPYFNPHGSTRTRGMSLAKKLKGRGDTFSKSSYLLQSEEKQHLIIEGNEMPWLDQETARRIVTVYDLAAVTIARTVTITDSETELSALGPMAILPGLLRETAQNILPSIKNHDQRVEALENAARMLSKGQAPTYKK